MTRPVLIGGALGAIGGGVAGYVVGRKIDKGAFGELFGIFGALAGGIAIAALADVTATPAQPPT